MIDEFNPYATLWPWIREAPLHPENNRDDAEDAWATIRDSSDIIDCRHVMVRVAVLRALALRGHPVLFALGAPWSALTDEQAGRLTAEIVRRVGAHPATPKGVLPTGVLGARMRRDTVGRGWIDTRPVIAGSPPVPHTIRGIRGGWWWCGNERGPESEEEGVAAAEKRAMEMGAILIEQITP